MKLTQIPIVLHSLLLVAIVALLAACGPKADTTPEPETPEKATVDEGLDEDEEMAGDDDEGVEVDEEDEEDEDE